MFCFVLQRAFRFCKDESARMVEVIDDAFVNVLEHGTTYGVAHVRILYINMSIL